MLPLNTISLQTEEEFHEERGHKRRYRWRTRSIHHNGPPQPRRVIVVEQQPRWDNKFSVTIPKSYSYWWHLECGHRVLPQRSIGFGNHWAPYPEGYQDPETAVIYCGTCQRALDTWSEERYREYYWEDGHKCYQHLCRSCRQCLIDKGHKPRCLEGTREYLMECIWETWSELKAEM